MSEASELLAQLRDAHEPAPPQTASSGLVLTCLTVLVVLSIATLLQRYRRRRHWLDDALSTLSEAARQNPSRARLNSARLIGRLLRERHGSGVDRLDASARLRLLDDMFATRWFTGGKGRAFGEALYRPSTGNDFDPARDCSTLARLLRKRHRHLRPRSTTDLPSRS